MTDYVSPLRGIPSRPLKKEPAAYANCVFHLQNFFLESAAIA